MGSELKYDRIGGEQMLKDEIRAREINPRENLQDKMDEIYSSPTRVLANVAKAEKENRAMAGSIRDRDGGGRSDDRREHNRSVRGARMGYPRSIL